LAAQLCDNRLATGSCSAPGRVDTQTLSITSTQPGPPMRVDTLSTNDYTLH